MDDGGKRPELPGEIRDPKALRALSHPLRWDLIELLSIEPTATATRCAEALDQSVASCSYHLNLLAKYGFVEQTGDGRGREKPWRLVRHSQSWSMESLDDEGAMAAEVLTDTWLDRLAAGLKRWQRRRQREPEEWRRPTGFTSTLTFVTSAELAEFKRDAAALFERYEHRITDPAARPPGSRPVQLFLSVSLPSVGAPAAGDRIVPSGPGDQAAQAGVHHDESGGSS
jgi:hypothetical protein